MMRSASTLLPFFRAKTGLCGIVFNGFYLIAELNSNAAFLCFLKQEALIATRERMWLSAMILPLSRWWQRPIWTCGLVTMHAYLSHGWILRDPTIRKILFRPLYRSFISKMTAKKAP
jgi:hypothetical protein